MEWTLGHEDPDSAGQPPLLHAGVRADRARHAARRQVLPGVEQLQAVAAGDGRRTTRSSRRSWPGDFTLPEDPRQKLVFIAGGIGITPFRSMIKYLIDTRQRRPITVFYANKTRQRHRLQGRARPGAAGTGHQDGLHHHRHDQLPGVVERQGRARRRRDDPSQVPDYRQRSTTCRVRWRWSKARATCSSRSAFTATTSRLDFFSGLA